MTSVSKNSSPSPHTSILEKNAERRTFLRGADTMERIDLARAIHHCAHITGEFKLRSGAVAAEYFDKYRFEADPKLLRAIAEALVPLVPPDVEVLAGLELGGVPIATVLSQVTGLPTVFVRKEPKTYGTSAASPKVETSQADDC